MGRESWPDPRDTLQTLLVRQGRVGDHRTQGRRGPGISGVGRRAQSPRSLPLFLGAENGCHWLLPGKKALAPPPCIYYDLEVTKKVSLKNSGWHFLGHFPQVQERINCISLSKSNCHK